MKTNALAHCNQADELAVDFEEIERNERRTLWAVFLTFGMMILEIAAGYWTGSMALLADGYHMASHAGALGISFFVYKLTKSESIKSRLSFGSGKLLPLGAYTSAIGLGAMSVWMVVESVERLMNPSTIQFNQAIAITVLGLAVNVLTAFILGSGGHKHSHAHGDDHNHDHGSHDHSHEKVKVEDHNHKSALFHVIADALTSVLALIALIAGKYFGISWLDPLMGVLGAVVILKWAYTLLKDTAWELLDGHPKSFSLKEVKETIEATAAKVIDLHIWKVGPGNHAVKLVVINEQRYGSEYYKQYFPKHLGSVHIVVEER